MNLNLENIFHNKKSVPAKCKTLLLVGIKSCRLLTPQGRWFPSSIFSRNVLGKLRTGTTKFWVHIARVSNLTVYSKYWDTFTFYWLLVEYNSVCWCIYPLLCPSLAVDVRLSALQMLLKESKGGGLRFKSRKQL